MAYTTNFTEALIDLVDGIVSTDKMELSEMLYTKTYETSDIAEKNEVVTGVRTGHVVPILKQDVNPDSFPFVDETSCEVSECDVTTEFASTSWELGLIECRVGICLRSFDEDFLRFFNQYRFTQEGEPDLDSALLEFISGQFTRNLSISTWRAAYFGDKSSASSYYDRIDGMFTQLEAGDASQIVTIAENAGADYATQTIGGEEVYDYLIEMYDKAAEHPWFDDTILEYRVTRSMASKLVSWLNKLGKKAPMNCNCIDPKLAVSKNVFTIEGLEINGIPVKTYNEWDTIINKSSELNGGGGVNARVNPHRAILTYKENLLIGTSQLDALNSFDIWYSKDDKKVYLEGGSYVGAAVPMMGEYILGI